MNDYEVKDELGWWMTAFIVGCIVLVAVGVYSVLTV